MGYSLDDYLGHDSSDVATAPPASMPAAGNDAIRSLILAKAEKYNIDPNVALALVKTESDGNPNAVGPMTSAGRARGLLQITDKYQGDYGVTPQTVMDPEANLDGGFSRLRANLDALGGDYSRAIAAHQAGLGAVQKSGGIPDTTDGLSTTHDYVAKVLRLAGGAPATAARAVPSAAPAPAASGFSLDDYLNHDASAAPAPSGVLRRVVGDGGVALVKGLVDIGQTAYQGVDAATGGALDRASGAITGGAANVANSILDPLTGHRVGAGTTAELLGDKPMTASSSRVDMTKLPTDRLSTGFNTLQDDVGSMFSPETQAASDRVSKAEGTWGTFKEALSNPSSIYTGILESIPISMTMGGAVRSVGLGMAERAGAEVAAKGGSAAAQKTAAQAVLDKFPTSAPAIGTQMASDFIASGAQQGGQAKDAILGLSPEDMAKSPAYQALIAKGMSPNDAVNQLADDGQFRGFVTAGVLSALTSPISAGIENKAALLGLRTKAADAAARTYLGIPAALKAGATEFAQEYLQSGGEQVGTNVGMQAVDPNWSTMKGVENQATMGGVTGFGMGVAFHAAGSHDGHAPTAPIAPTPQVATADTPTAIRTASQASSPQEAATLPVTPIMTPDEIAAGQQQRRAVQQTQVDAQTDDSLGTESILAAMHAHANAEMQAIRTYAPAITGESMPEGATVAADLSRPIRVTPAPAGSTDPMAAPTAAPVAPGSTPIITPSAIDAAAHEAATSPTNDLPEPTLPQKEAGNYKKGHVAINGLDITIENPRGSTRTGLRPDGSEWSHTMSDHYGYIKRTIGADEEQVDTYIGPRPYAPNVYVVDQVHQDGKGFDEHKAMIGYPDEASARAAYASNFDPGWKTGPVTTMSVPEFKAWVRGSDVTAPAHPEFEAIHATQQSADRTAPGEAPDAAASGAAAVGHGEPEGASVPAATPDLSPVGGGEPVSLPADAGAASAPALTHPEPGIAFTTAKGSRYVVGENGSTTRDKAARTDVGHEGDSGPQKPSERTVYASKEAAQTLSEFQAQGSKRSIVLSDEGDRTRAAMRHDDGPSAGMIERRTVVDVDRHPTPGLTPVETWQGGKVVHFGNEITSVEAKQQAPALKSSGNSKLDEARAAKTTKPATSQVPHGVDGETKYVLPSFATAQQAKTAAKPETRDEPAKADASLQSKLEHEIAAGRMPKDNPALRKLVEAHDGNPADAPRMKQAQEALESAIVGRAREIAAAGDGKMDAAFHTFNRLVALYDSQPNLNVRTSTSIANQAYSTPAPLAFVASRLAGVTKSTTVYEPTAGNGMLLIQADPAKATVNELNDERAASLRAQGFDVTQNNATTYSPAPLSIDRIIANPPFGPIKDDAGNSIKLKIDGFTMSQIDHVIAARALEAMKDDGHATLIIGANKVAGGLSNPDRIFFNWLYSHYDVASHFEVDGDLYHRQGADWPVRVLTIAGRRESEQTSPQAGTIERVGTWDKVYERFQQGVDAVAAGAESRDSAERPVLKRGDDARPVPAAVRGEARDADRSGPAGRATGDGDVAGRGAGTVDDRGARAVESVASADHAERPVPAADEQPVVEGNDRSGKQPADAPRRARADSLDAGGNEFQTKYVARSDRKDEGVLIPVNMAGPTQDALSSLEDAVGDIDKFAAKELGYPSVAALHDGLMGLQVDSVASAIQQIKSGKGIIIADQTGIGKGRQAAAIIRWAARTGKIPVFVTVKPSLFTDMHGDLHDIGSTDIAPFIVNVDQAVKGENDERLFANRPNGHKKNLERMMGGELPEGRNAVFMTYSQINTDNLQRKALMGIAHKSVFILDESHNAGGDSGTGEFIRGALDVAPGVTYLSATYAKRPDNMPLYFKTDMGDAVADDETLMNAMAAGGLPLQTVVSNNLVKAGQMFRRERSYDGVSIQTRSDTDHKAEHVKLSDTTTSALRAIVNADRTFHTVFVKAMQKEAEKSGGRVFDNAGNQAKASVDHTQFSSVVHNFVRQMLLGLKAQEAANRAITALDAGKKPLIAVENTMGSFLQEYADANGLKDGDALGAFDYRTVLSCALDRTRYYVKDEGNGDKVRVEVPLSQLDASSREAYDKAQSIIDHLDIDIPVSPLDWMRQEITNAGHSVAEVTGRNLAVDYSDPANPKLSKVDALEQADKVRTTRLFNSGKTDALILNVAGSTGISLHASEKFTDQRPRRMIVAQAAQDINIFMQMLGRIHRTGQVELPSYEILNADLPAEIRPTALLSGKMKSLNANTSSNTESATSVKAVDMLNKYGDTVVGQYLNDNPELAKALDLAPTEDGETNADIARKATGRLALMPVKQQAEFYAEVEEQYRALLDYLNKTNQNDLEPRTMDLDARETKSSVLFQGEKPESPFGQDAIYNEFSIKAQGKAMSPAEITAAMTENLDGKTGAQHQAALAGRLDDALKEYQGRLASSEDPEAAANAASAARPGRAFISDHAIGSMFRIEVNGESYNAIVTNLRSTHKAAGNPFAMSKLQVTLAVNGALRSLTVPATQFEAIRTGHMDARYNPIEKAFKEGPKDERETAKIITGNLLGAYGEMQGGARGSIISFTKADGTIEQGILMPKSFNVDKDTRQDYRVKSAADAFKFLTTSNAPNVERFGLSTRDGVVRVLPEGNNGVTIQVPKSKAKGGKYFLDKTILNATGDFASTGNTMRATVYGEGAAVRAIEAIQNKQALYVAPSMVDDARELLNDPVPTPGATPALEDIGAKQKQTATPALPIKSATSNTGAFDASKSSSVEDIGRAGAAPSTARAEAARVPTLQRLKKLRTLLDSGTLSSTEAADEVSQLIERTQARNDAQAENRAGDRERGAAWVTERLMRAERTGEIDGRTAELGRWLLGQNPNLANDLGVSIRQSSESSGAGLYNPISRVFTLFKGDTNDGTAVHEILHHTERMMPAAVQDGIVAAHARAFADAMKAADGNEKRTAALMDMAEGAAGDRAAYARVRAAFDDGTLDYAKDYGLTNASEYWATKATDILLGREAAGGSWVAKAKQWLSGLVEHVKAALGLRSDSAVLKGLDAVLSGDGKQMSSRLLAERAGSLAGPLMDLTASARDMLTTVKSGAMADNWNTVVQSVHDKVLDAVTPSTHFSLWARTVGTQMGKARTTPEFRPVFERAQKFLNDITKVSLRAEGLASTLLPKVGGLKDVPAAIGQAFGKGGVSRADNEWLGKTLAEGTLDGKDTGSGPSPLEGRLFTEGDLRAKGATDNQVRIYNEAIAAIHQSLEDSGRATMISMLRANGVEQDTLDKLDLAAPRMSDILAWADENIGDHVDEMKAAAKEKLQDGKADLNARMKAELAKTTMPSAQLAIRERYAQEEEPLRDQAYAEADAAEAVLTRLRDVMDKGRALQDAGYAPLMRFGRYFLTAYQGDSVEFFRRYDSKTELAREQRAMQKANPAWTFANGEMSKEEFRQFQGVDPATMALFAKEAGLHDEAFQKWYELATAERSAMKRLLHRSGTEGYSLDARRSVASFITSNARFASSALNTAALADTVAAVKDGGVKDEAIELQKYVTNPVEEAAKLRGFMFSHFIGGSLASGIVNLTQPILMTYPYLAGYGPAKAAAAMKEGIAAAVSSMRDKAITNPELAAAMDRAKREGVVDPSEIHALMAASRGAFTSPARQAFQTVWGANFAVTEAFNRKSTFAAAFLLAQRAGEADPFEVAKKAVYDTQGLYSRANRPNWARGAVGATLFTFKQFSIGYVEFLQQLVREGKMPKTQLSIALALLILASGTQGLPGADDLDDIIDALGQSLGYGTNIRQKKRQVLESIMGKTLAQMTLYGGSTQLGIDFQGRLGFGNMIPGTGALIPSNPNKGKDIAEWAGPLGSLITNGASALGHLLGGDFKAASADVSSSAARNAATGFTMLTTGEARDDKGRTIKDVSPGEAIGKMAGFTPQRIATESRAITEIKRDENIVSMESGKIRDQWAAGIARNDPAAVREAQQRLKDWNADNPDLPIKVKPQDVMKKAKDMQTLRANRTLRSVPTGLKQSAAEGLEQ